MTVKIIAEAGVNHNGQLDLALQLVDVAKKAGADVIKFQTFKAADLVTVDAKQCEYQSKNSQKLESQLSMLERLELSQEEHYQLQAYCHDVGIEFLSSAFDSNSLTFLLDEMRLDTLKVASGEITNFPFLLEHARSGCDIIVSTGMSTLVEVEQALAVLAFGLTKPSTEFVSQEGLLQAFSSEQGQRALQQKVSILHCTTEYPASITDINLRAMDTMGDKFGLTIGYSDHSQGIHVALAAVARGASIIEKHFTLDKTMAGPDHKASLDPDELTEMIKAIRAIELALGDGIKKPFAKELENLQHARKSLVCIEQVAIGETFSQCNLGVKRPGDGMHPRFYWELLGRKATRAYAVGDKVDEDFDTLNDISDK